MLKIEFGSIWNFFIKKNRNPEKVAVDTSVRGIDGSQNSFNKFAASPIFLGLQKPEICKPRPKRAPKIKLKRNFIFAPRPHF